MNASDSPHIPVLLTPVLQLLEPKQGDRYLDLTAGYGGHARAILELTGTVSSSVLVDRDAYALEHLTDLHAAHATLLHTDYADAVARLHERHETFDLICMDLGVSSPQLDLPERGFSFMRDGPLDMRMDPSTGRSASQLLNDISERELTDILTTYGEESKGNALKIAQAVIRQRPTTTHQLATMVTDALGGRRGRIHPATKTFQALRLAVNDELGQLERTLVLIPELLNPGGRIAIISFHSLEDRIVKRYFKEQAPDSAGYEAKLRILTNKPIESQDRDANLPFYDFNPRARSAKLRVAVKI